MGRLAWRKLIYRKIPMGIMSIRAGDTRRPSTPTSCTFEVWGPERYDDILAANPNLAPVDIEHFRRQQTTLIVALDDGELAASTWMTNGRTWISELHRFADFPPNEHLSCRTYVPEAYRGQALMAWMIHHYSVQVDPDDTIWGLVYERNAASIRSVENLGWRRTGDIWSHIVLGRSVGSSRSYPPRAPLPRRPVDPATGERRDPPAALVLAGTVHAGPLHAARAIHRLGAAVHIATSGSGAALLGRSRAVATATDLALDGADDPAEIVLRWIERTAPEQGPVPVIPTNDRFYDLLHQVRHRLPDHVVPLLPPEQATDALVDKASSIELAERAGLEVPRWRAVRAPGDIAGVHDLTLPVIVRPTAWRTGGAHRFKVALAHRPEEVDRLLERSLADGAEVIASEYLAAPDDAVEFALVWRSLDGSATEVCTGRKRRQASPDGGVMAWGEAVDLPDVRAAALAMLDETGFTGLGGVEVIRHDGRLWFIEMNPRLEAIHHLAIAAGVDLVGIAYEDAALGQLPRLPSSQAPAAAWSSSGWLERVRSERSAVRTALRDHRDFRRHANRTTAVWSSADPGPGLAAVGQLVRRALRRGGPTR
jgi:predicted ATP-grasp superfamily ATP-dependent carboligase